MARAGSELTAEADMVVPVPLHRWRLWTRRFNQAALLAQGIARQLKVTVSRI
jgi:predicted amidophosphoribosyltransferase